jgi:hypothetical protein
VIAEPVRRPAVIDGVDVDAVATAVQSCPGVSGLHGGPFGEIGSYLPGRRVAGVQVTKTNLTVQVRSKWDVPVAELSRQLRPALAGLAGAKRIDIIVADIDDPPGEATPDLLTEESELT